MKRSSVAIVIGGLVALGLTVTPATKAVTISTNVGVNGTFSVSATDLINTGQVSFLSLVQNSGTAMYSSALSNLNDGSIYLPPGIYAETTRSFVPSSGSVVTVTLDTSSGERTNGYAISSLVSLTGYAGGSSYLFLGHFFNLEFSYVGSTSFSSVATVAVPSPGIDDRELQVTLTNFGIAGYGVDEIRFTFNNPSFQSVLREIDVFGQVIPEPASGLMFVFGCAALALLRRRK